MKLQPNEQIFVRLNNQWVDKTAKVNEYEFKNNLCYVWFNDNSAQRNEYSTKNVCIKPRDNAKTKANASVFEYLSRVLQISFKHSQNATNQNNHSTNHNDETNTNTDSTLGDFLIKEFEKINPTKTTTLLHKYLNQTASLNRYKCGFLIFPFGSNLSQYNAVKNALENQLSIIEGPPGTGKTQTILNIIANLLIHNKTIAVVSNNNAATQNVYEKLQNCGLGGICAVLGNSANKNKFIENQAAQLEKITALLNEAAENEAKIPPHPNQSKEINRLNGELVKLFELQNKIAKSKALLTKLELEFTHFKDGAKPAELPKISPNTNPNTLLYLKNQIIENGKIGFFSKLKLVFWDKIGSFGFYKKPLLDIAAAFEWLFYELSIAQTKAQIDADAAQLGWLEAQDALNKLKTLSMQMLKSNLARRLRGGGEPKTFSGSDLFCRSYDFLRQYPVIFSTTHSILKSLCPQIEFDYVVCDEASQVSLITGALALYAAQNIVIVGDTKQLPHVIAGEMKKDLDKLALWRRNNEIPDKYDYSNSFLASAGMVFANAPRTLLKEHYRCHPKIIEFCNQRFYGGELVILTKDGGEQDVIKLHFTAQGNHAHDNVNQREIDEIKQCFLPELAESEVSGDEIGIIAPYKNQTKTLGAQIVGDGLEIDTVHKFQGREKNVIIISTTANKINDFINDPHILNVAVSRAKRALRIVASPQLAQDNSYIGDLIKYIQYNNFEVKESKIRSIFDLLYEQNALARIEFLKNAKKISDYESENIAYHTIGKILRGKDFANLSVSNHVPLYSRISNPSVLNQDELKYAFNPLTHIDFVIFHAMDKLPVLAIEVDGRTFHCENSQQARRDKLKNDILEKCGIPLMRLKTTGNSEEERITQCLNEILQKSSNGSKFEFGKRQRQNTNKNSKMQIRI